jgi:hypothetical protein
MTAADWHGPEETNDTRDVEGEDNSEDEEDVDEDADEIVVAAALNDSEDTDIAALAADGLGAGETAGGDADLSSLGVEGGAGAIASVCCGGSGR